MFHLYLFASSTEMLFCFKLRTTSQCDRTLFCEPANCDSLNEVCRFLCAKFKCIHISSLIFFPFILCVCLYVWVCHYIRHFGAAKTIILFLIGPCVSTEYTLLFQIHAMLRKQIPNERSNKWKRSEKKKKHTYIYIYIYYYEGALVNNVIHP